MMTAEEREQIRAESVALWIFNAIRVAQALYDRNPAVEARGERHWLVAEPGDTAGYLIGVADPKKVAAALNKLTVAAAAAGQVAPSTIY